MKFETIAIIGAGNLGLSIAKGILKAGLLDGENLYLSEKNVDRRKELNDEGFQAVATNVEAVKSAELVMMVVKPWQMDDVLEDIKDIVKEKNPVLVSCATGITSPHIFQKLESEPTLFRVMPNTGVAVGESMSCIASFNESREQRDGIKAIFESLGQVLFISEDQMPAATAVAGCGIAFALRFIRAVIQAGVETGFSAQDAKLLAAQITKGAADLIIENDSHPEAEIDKVTTPKGITITGLNSMEHAGFSSSIIQGVNAAFEKIERSE